MFTVDSILPIIEIAIENIFLFGVMFIVTLAIVITIHELGHYWAARICKVYVEQFSFGFGREIFGFGGGEFKTRWSICLFPIGGFVKLFGDVDVNNPIVWDHENSCERTLTKEELDVSFCTKKLWQRAFIIAAGPAINILLTFSIFAIMFSTYGQKSSPLFINAIAVNSAAFYADVKIGDNLLEMDGQKVRRLEDVYDLTWYENPPAKHKYKILRDGRVIFKEFAAKRIEYINIKGVDMSHGQTGMVRMGFVELDGIISVNDIITKDNPAKVRELILANMDREIEVGLPFKGEKKSDPFIIMFPSKFNTHLENPSHEYYDRAFLVDPNNKFFVRLTPFESVNRSVFLIRTMVVDSYKLIKAMIKGRNDDPILGGVSKISEYTARAVEAGMYEYLMFIAGFSLMIAMINLLPIPALDGGYLVFILYELIARKPIPPRIQDLALLIGMMFLVGIMIFANVNDLIYMVTPIDSR